VSVFFKATSEFDDVLKDYDKLAQKVTTLEAKNRDLAKGVKQGGDDSDSFFKSQHAGIAAMLTGWASIEGAIRLVGSALQFAQAETDEAVGSMDKLADSRRRLAQISLTGKDLDRVDKRADELAMQFGVDRDVARDTVFNATSLGAADALPSIFKFSDVLDTDTATTAAGKLPAIFQGQLNSEQALAMGHTASMDSALSFTDFMASLPTAAQGVKMAGGSPAEAAALVSVLSEDVADKTQAGTLMRAFGTKVGINKETFGEQTGILDAVKKLQAMPEGDRKDFLGDSQELNVAFKMLTDKMEKIEQRESQVQSAIDTAGTDQSPLEQARRAVFDHSTDIGRKNIAGLEKRRAAIRRDVIREDRFGESGALADAAIDTGLGDLDEARAGSLGKFAGMTAGKTAKLFQAPQAAIEGATAGTGAGFSLPSFFGLGSFGASPLRSMVQREQDRRREPTAPATSTEAAPAAQQDKQLAVLEEMRDAQKETATTLKQMNTAAAGAAGNRETR
jgi:hypothetical protein